MRLKSLLSAAATVLAVTLLAAAPANAGGSRHHPDGWGHARTVKHHVYYPRYVHQYHVDPYTYRYSPRGYYPYYNSGYWAKSSYIKWRTRKRLNEWNGKTPRYYKSWGYPRPEWRHKEWHYEHHGRHHRWHW